MLSSVDTFERPRFWQTSVASGLISLIIAAPCTAQDDLPERALLALESGGLVWPPYVVGNLSINLFNDYTFSADDPNAEINDAFADISLDTFVFLTRHLYIESSWAVSPVGAPVIGRDRFFEDHALKWTTLSLTYERENFWISAGKGSVRFGIARSLAPGVYGADIASDFYSIDGRVGFGANYAFDAGVWGNHAVRGAVFTRDNSWLATPFFSDFERPSRESGGAGNTDGLESWAISLDGGGFTALPGFRYHLAYASQPIDFLMGPSGGMVPQNQLADERRYVIAGTWDPLDLGGGVSVAPLIEYARLENARGFRNRSESYLTGSLDFSFDQWNLAIASTLWDVETTSGSDVRNHQSQVSVGYTFENGVTLEAGYRFLDEDDETSSTIGVALNYEIPFSF